MTFCIFLTFFLVGSGVFIFLENINDLVKAFVFSITVTSLFFMFVISIDAYLKHSVVI